MANSSSSSSSSNDTIRILVVDNDNTCLSIIAAILKKFNYQVVAVKNATDALFNLERGAFDLVVADVHLPDMDGFELQRVISEEFDLPVVLMSADDKEGIAMKSLEGGAAFFFIKPISPDDARDLWQFVAMKKRSNHNVLIEETQENASMTKKKP